MTDRPEWSDPTGPSQPMAPPPATPYPYAYPPGPYPGGYPPPPMPYGDYPPYPAVARNGLGVAALVIGILALVGSFSVAGGVIGGLVAMVLGFAGRARARSGEASNGGVALAGIIVGALAIVAGLIFVAVWVGLFNQIGAGDYLDCLQQAGQDRDQVQLCAEEFRQSMENRFTLTRTATP